MTIPTLLIKKDMKRPATHSTNGKASSNQQLQQTRVVLLDRDLGSGSVLAEVTFGNFIFFSHFNCLKISIFSATHNLNLKISRGGKQKICVFPSNAVGFHAKKETFITRRVAVIVSHLCILSLSLKKAREKKREKKI